MIGGVYMKKPAKRVNRLLAWVFSMVIATGTLVGYGKLFVPTAEYGVPDVVVTYKSHI